MSRSRISNHITLARDAAILRHRAKNAGFRALLVVQNPPDGWLRSFALEGDLPFRASVDGVDRADRITEVLGQEFDSLVHDTLGSVDAGFLAALAGTIRAGGLLILGLPFAVVHETPDSPQAMPSRFNLRLSRLLLQLQARHPQTVSIIDGKHLPPIPPADQPVDQPVSQQASREEVNGAEAAADNTKVLTDCPERRQAINPAAELEQNQLLEAACQHLSKHDRSCIIISGRRGRGKSALLGRIAHWMNQHGMSLSITAARKGALNSVVRHGIPIDFQAPGLAALPGSRALLVDEAASLPITTLLQYLSQHDHVIYCTTVEGYEQAGRAFDIRFLDALTQRPHAVLSLKPTQAWRWTSGDPLEEFLDTLLMRTALKSHYVPNTSARLIRRLDRTALALDESLLSGIYTLLRNSHYQTSASDISHLLDGPEVQIWVLEENRTLCAALFLVLEGDIDPALNEAIISKQRRLPHQLLPQLLAQCANLPSPLQTTIARVIRIAVTPEKRRQGLGSTLLQAVVNALTGPDGQATAIGASFASDPGNLDFWKSNGFTRFHTGYRRNPRTGERAVAVLQSSEACLSTILGTAVRLHDDNQAWLQNKTGETVKSTDDRPLLERFALGQRSQLDTYAALSRLALEHPLPLSAPEGMTTRQHQAELRAAVNRYLQSH